MAKTAPCPAALRYLDLRRASLVFVLGAVVAAVSVAWIDRPLALAIAHVLPPGASVPSTIPDLLIEFVIVVGLAGVVGWIWARWHGNERLLRVTPLVAATMPISLGVSELGKWLFGRTTTRLFVHHPRAYGFHWGDGHSMFFGFPSGHMLVATALIVVVIAVYPRWRWLGWALLAALALAMLLTSYHFLGDIVAGWLIGATLAQAILAADARLRPAKMPQTRP
ncbi:MAG: phosphatase PAP2 family protein [Gammaproteobacteria bacterium]